MVVYLTEETNISERRKEPDFKKDWLQDDE